MIIKPFKHWSQVVLPQVYDDALSYYETLNRIVVHLNNIGNAVNQLGDTVNTANDNVNSVVGEIDGIRADVDALLVQAGYFTPQMYNAVGDGVTNDADAFRNAFRAAKTAKGYLIIPNGVYNIVGIGVTELPSNIIGDSATLLVDGHTDVFTYDKVLKMYGVNFNVSGTGETAVITYSGVADEVIIDNVTMDAVGGSDVTRYFKGIRVHAVKSSVTNCVFKNMIHGVIFNNSAELNHESIRVDNVQGYNIATLVDLEGSYGSETVRGGGEFNNATISNVSLFNTANNKASIVDEVGRDALLVGGCKTLFVDNVYGEYCRERVVYINCVKSCTVNNVSGRHCQIIKVAGYNSGDVPYISENIIISGVSGYDIDNGYLLTLYDVDGVSVENLYCHNELSGLNCDTLVNFERTCKNISINNATFKNATRGIIRIRNVDGYDNVFENVKLSNFLCYNPVIKTTYDVIIIDHGSAVTKWIDGLYISNFAVNPSSPYYRASSNVNELITLNHCDHVTIDNIILRDTKSTNGGIMIGDDTSNIEVHAYLTMATRGGIVPWANKVSIYSDITGRASTAQGEAIFTSLSNATDMKGISEGVYNVEAGVTFSLVPDGIPCLLRVTGPKSGTFSYNGSRFTTITADDGFTFNYNQINIDTAGTYYMQFIY